MSQNRRTKHLIFVSIFSSCIYYTKSVPANSSINKYMTKEEYRQKNLSMFTLTEEQQIEHNKRLKRDRERHLSQYTWKQ